MFFPGKILSKIDCDIYLTLLFDNLTAFGFEGDVHNIDLTDDSQRLVVESTEIFENCTIKPPKVPAGKTQNTTVDVIFRECAFLLLLQLLLSRCSCGKLRGTIPEFASLPSSSSLSLPYVYRKWD